MRFVLRAMLVTVLLLLLLAVAFLGDVALNGRRVFYALLGRDAIVAACRPPLLARLRDMGFEPDALEFGGQPDIAVSTRAGRTLRDSFTFGDGATQTRVDGVLSCSVKDGATQVDVETSSTPVRAT